VNTDSIAELLGQVPLPTSAAREVGLRPGQVTRSDDGGVFVTVLGSSTAAPIGPCRGATYLREVATATSTGAGSITTYRYLRTPLPKGASVLVANTDAGPWIVRHDL
jgi:hypothetical protein